MNEREILLAGALLRVSAARLRGLALGSQPALSDWIATTPALRVARARRDGRLALVRLESLGARLIALGEREYPSALLDLPDPPSFLTARGFAIPLGGTAIVGTRTPSADGLAMAAALAQRVAEPVVSGLALGIDGAAHRGALSAGTPTIAYVGHGFGATYPPEHRALENDIVAAGGAILSEHLVGEPVTKWSLVRRDRLQAAHARACILVESELGGGAMHAMRFAARLARPRFALEHRAGDERTGGNARAIAEGATPLCWDAEQALATLKRSLSAVEPGAVPGDASVPRRQP